MQIIQTNNYEAITKLNKDVQDLHSELYPEYFKEYDFEAIKDFFKKVVENPSFIFLLIEDNEQYLGYAWIEIKEYPENAFKRSYRSLYIHQISIAKSEKNKGLGTKLMEKITEIADRNNIKKIELNYWYSNNVAKEFYHKNGYKKYREFVYKELY